MKTSKTFMLVTIFPFAVASVWVAAVCSASAQTSSGYTTAIAPVSQPKATTQASPAGGRLGQEHHRLSKAIIVGGTPKQM